MQEVNVGHGFGENFADRIIPPRWWMWLLPWKWAWCFRYKRRDTGDLSYVCPKCGKDFEDQMNSLVPLCEMGTGEQGYGATGRVSCFYCHHYFYPRG